MVKPTPPRTDTPPIWPQFTPCGRSDSFSFTVSHVARKMPSGLPNSRPQNTPMVTGFVTMDKGSMPVSTTLAFENANSGRMKKYTGMCRRWSRRVIGGMDKRDTRPISATSDRYSFCTMSGSPGS